jgi:hypothetical protein
MPSNDAVDTRSAEVRAIEQRHQRILAVFSVVGGLAQLPMLRWLKSNYSVFTAKGVALGIFLIYFGVVIVMIVRMNKAMRDAANR